MNERLTKLRALIQAQRASKEGYASAQYRAEEMLRLLDEYQKSLVHIEGVESTLVDFEESGRAMVVDGNGGIYMNVKSDGLIQVETASPPMSSAPILDCEGMRQHAAQVLAAVLYLEGKRTQGWHDRQPSEEE